MHLSTLLSLATAAAATPLAARQATNLADLAPWKITSLFSYKPSSQPGPDKNSRISLRITDPNTIKLMRASRFGFGVFQTLTSDCTISWVYLEDVPPFGEEVLCVATGDGASAYGNFSVVLQPGAGDENVLDFKIKLVERREVSILNHYFYRQFEGGMSFKAGENYQGSCSDAGVCAGQLASEAEIQQTVTESVGSCEEYGGCA
ncbi:uncharacterized protein M421DRAFT_422571 [Didymella exigua CBS 183.55]|uniref:Cell death in tomato 1 n=1 Tax=Didymella exigua CBS 183.55 TaxID=1150837 RepID=A0A6A5RJK4_9PLEO|nr:uncharacterized protein M421DRAFT_422571 [Didymella exigua CBS 183.55]KAF1926596.1 hypothetical protein M421DRAFT_422571 [Didymella exigua CBS 183.55]